MAGELDKLKAFFKAAEGLSKDSLQTELTVLYRDSEETFLMDGFVYVDVGQIKARTGTNAVWTDGAAGGCTALAVVDTSKAVLAHIVRDSDTKPEQKVLKTMVKPTQIALATAPGWYLDSLTNDKSARESSLFGAIDALEKSFTSLSLNEIAQLTTVITGFDGRTWTHECVLAAHTYSGIGFFMGADQSESSSLGTSQQWRIRRNSFNGGQKPLKKMPGLTFKKQKLK